MSLISEHRDFHIRYKGWILHLLMHPFNKYLLHGWHSLIMKKINRARLSLSSKCFQLSEKSDINPVITKISGDKKKMYSAIRLWHKIKKE